MSYEKDSMACLGAIDKLGRALRHLLLWQAGDSEDGSRDEHLVHAACRVLMALEEIRIEEQRDREVRESELEQLRLEYGYRD